MTTKKKQKKPKQKKPKQKMPGPPAAGAAARVRMYRTGLGDCFLLTFPRPDDSSFHMLVDCGVFFQTPNEKQVLRDAATHIRAATGGTIDVLVGTHEHYDHLIGFKHARDIFSGMTIREVWLPWIERPGEPRAAWLRALENKLKLGLQLALRQAMATPDSAAAAAGLANVLQFGGDPLAADYSDQLGEVKRWLRDELTPSVRYLEPHGDAIELVPGVRVYPLGPPVKESFFRRMNDSQTDPQTYGPSFAFSAVPAFLTSHDQANDPETREAHELAQPFEARWQIPAAHAPAWRLPAQAHEPSARPGEQFFARRYGFAARDPDAWRRIDNNWLAEAENLALQLDSLTNNSSLALAIEIGSARRVILMAADAQVGNWLSWHDATWRSKSDSGATMTVSAEDLLSRTVLYKVGHHGSHNATLRQKGLDMMTSDELVAMIPVDQDFANNVKHWAMPFPGLLTALSARTQGRVLRVDHGLPAQAQVVAGVRKAFFESAAAEPLFAEYLLPV
jgi:glyoxylase-like metal-dependent hydrolase (beta-lactamase superfamily II)